MYKCRVVYDEWKCIKEKNRIGVRVRNSEYEGYLGILSTGKVEKKQVWTYNGDDVVICDDGYYWLTILPQNEFYCITVMMDFNYEVKVSYIDMIDKQGNDEDGVPFFYDMYLDLVVYPDGTVIVDDKDELDKALSENVITKDQYDRTLLTSKELQEKLLADRAVFATFIKNRLDEMRYGVIQYNQKII